MARDQRTRAVTQIVCKRLILAPAITSLIIDCVLSHLLPRTGPKRYNLEKKYFAFNAEKNNLLFEMQHEQLVVFYFIVILRNDRL